MDTGFTGTREAITMIRIFSLFLSESWTKYANRYVHVFGLESGTRKGFMFLLASLLDKYGYGYIHAAS